MSGFSGMSGPANAGRIARDDGPNPRNPPIRVNPRPNLVAKTQT